MHVLHVAFFCLLSQNCSSVRASENLYFKSIQILFYIDQLPCFWADEQFFIVVVYASVPFRSNDFLYYLVVLIIDAVNQSCFINEIIFGKSGFLTLGQKGFYAFPPKLTIFLSNKVQN